MSVYLCGTVDGRRETSRRNEDKILCKLEMYGNIFLKPKQKENMDEKRTSF